MKIAYIFKVRVKRLDEPTIRITYGPGGARILTLKPSGTDGDASAIGNYSTVVANDDYGNKWWLCGFVADHKAFAGGTILAGPMLHDGVYNTLEDVHSLFGVVSGGVKWTAALQQIYATSNEFYSPHTEIYWAKQRPVETLDDYIHNLATQGGTSQFGATERLPSIGGFSWNSSYDPEQMWKLDWLPYYLNFSSNVGGLQIGSITTASMQYPGAWLSSIDDLPSWLSDVDASANVFRYNNSRAAIFPDAPSQSAPPPVEVPETDEDIGTTNPDDQVLETRLVSIQTSLGLIVERLNATPTRAELLEVAKKLGDSMVTVNNNIVQSGTNLIELADRIPSTTTRVVETAGVSALVSLLVAPKKKSHK